MAISNASIATLKDISIKKDACVVIVSTEWNADIVDGLLESCTATLSQHDVKFIMVKVPGAAEIPFAIKAYWDHHKFKDSRPHAFIALGCVIQGDTPHFDFICKMVTEGILQLNLTLCVPTIFGVLTVNTTGQAHDRLNGTHSNKGEEFAIGAIKMLSLNSQF